MTKTAPSSPPLHQSEQAKPRSALSSQRRGRGGGGQRPSAPAASLRKSAPLFGNNTSARNRVDRRMDLPRTHTWDQNRRRKEGGGGKCVRKARHGAKDGDAAASKTMATETEKKKCQRLAAKFDAATRDNNMSYFSHSLSFLRQSFD